MGCRGADVARHCPGATTIDTMDQVLYDFTRQDRSGAERVAQAWAKVPPALSAGERQAAKARAAALLEQA